MLQTLPCVNTYTCASALPVLTIISYKRHILLSFFNSWHVCLHLLLLHQHCLWLHQLHIWRLHNIAGLSLGQTSWIFMQLQYMHALLFTDKFRVTCLCGVAQQPTCPIPVCLFLENIHSFLLKASCVQSSTVPLSLLWCAYLTLDAVRRDGLAGCVPCNSSAGPKRHIHLLLKHAVYTKTRHMSIETHWRCAFQQKQRWEKVNK